MSKLSFVCNAPGSFRDTPTRCGKCSGCRSLRAWLKSLRVHLEAYGHEGRVWLASLTFRKETTDEDGYPEVQKWLKRVRKEASKVTDDPVRFTCVSELGALHQRLHYHVVVYCGADLKWRMLNSWSAGHAHYKLVSGYAAAKYVLKYLSKGHGKVRSSQKLGSAIMQRVYANELVQSVEDAFPGAVVKTVCGTRVPRELLNPAPPSTEQDQEWKEWTRENSTRISHSGMSDHVWDQWCKNVEKSKFVPEPDLSVRDSERLDSPDDTTAEHAEGVRSKVVRFEANRGGRYDPYKGGT